MKPQYFVINLISIIILLSAPLFSSAASISVNTATVMQGEPFMATIEGIKLAEIKSASFDAAPVKTFLYQGKPTIIFGVDNNKNPGDYALSVKLTNNNSIEKTITITERKKLVEPFSIPDKLGGNTVASQNNLVSTLSKENDILAKLWSQPKALWTKKFIYPIPNPVVTDPYGYNRKTGEYTIAHKGTDFHAVEGTKVMAENRGIVRLAKTFTIYGNTVIIDHGLGLFTFYMHLSKINVNQGELVLPGRVIGLSGHTGYAEFPHLHLSVRINGSSIDPVKFMALFK